MKYRIGRRIEMIPEHPLEHARLWLHEAEDKKESHPIHSKVCLETARKIILDYIKERISAGQPQHQPQNTNT
jgi:hypothetical protein